MSEHNRQIVGPATLADGPRYAGPSTFARLPRADQVGHVDIAVVGVPFDSGSTYRPGARFGPTAIRQASRLLRPYHPDLDIEPFGQQQVADAGDLACTPFDAVRALEEIDRGAMEVLADCGHLMALGGDHTVALALLRTVRRRFGPVAVVHFDAHLDTWSRYLDSTYNHGTPFRRAVEEGLLAPGSSIHIGLRGSLPARRDLDLDSDLGFRHVSAMRVAELGVRDVSRQIRERVGASPVYVSVDIDVLDPAYAPGTGTPEAGGLSTRELLAILRGMAGIKIVSADVVEVSPAYDHAEITALAAAHITYELLCLIHAGRISGV